MSELSDASPQDIVAGAGRYYRNARYVICAMALGAGLWFAKDGWITYTNELNDFLQMSPEQRATVHKPHSETDINLQKYLASGLIPLAPLLLGIFLYRSRGEYRLSGTTLHVPGHPPVPVEAMTNLDKSKWKRKGIAYIDYKLQGSKSERRLTLDDFVYEQIPTDKIVECLDHWLNGAEAEAIDETSGVTDAEENSESNEV